MQEGLFYILPFEAVHRFCHRVKIIYSKEFILELLEVFQELKAEVEYSTNRNEVPIKGMEIFSNRILYYWHAPKFQPVLMFLPLTLTEAEQCIIFPSNHFKSIYNALVSHAHCFCRPLGRVQFVKVMAYGSYSSPPE
jgi:hypothetical protein